MYSLVVEHTLAWHTWDSDFHLAVWLSPRETQAYVCSPQIGCWWQTTGTIPHKSLLVNSWLYWDYLEDYGGLKCGCITKKLSPAWVRTHESCLSGAPCTSHRQPAGESPLPSLVIEMTNLTTGKGPGESSKFLGLPKPWKFCVTFWAFCLFTS